MKKKLLPKLIGGLCILSMTYFVGCGESYNTEKFNDNVIEYLSDIEKTLSKNVTLQGGINIRENIKGKLLLHIDDRVEIDIMEGVNNIYDSKVDIVVISEIGGPILRIYQSIDFYNNYDIVSKMSPEDQVVWDSIYNSLVNQDTKYSSHMICYHE